MMPLDADNHIVFQANCFLPFKVYTQTKSYRSLKYVSLFLLNIS